MTETVIRVENLGKRYVLGQSQGSAPYQTLRESVTSLARAAFRRRAPGPSSATDDFWALKGVSFNIRRGEVVGVIGRNGAGKSTLLKILSRITEPTEGRIRIKGRVASLLEVGTGFHPELTGRENIFLNGAILGMSRAEIRRNFDEIVAFAEMSRFLDTPVKRYSSGMYMRLAFAVAAHLNPEILIVDEVLAVGDSDFQKKCLGKMEDVSRGGRTVIFVSHNMAAIARICSSALLLGKGTVLQRGDVPEVVRQYLAVGLDASSAREWSDLAKAPGNDAVRLRAVRVRTADGETLSVMDVRQPIGIEVVYTVLRPEKALVVNFTVHNEDGLCLFHPHDWPADSRREPQPPGDYSRTAWIPGNFLAEGDFLVSVAISSYNPLVVYCHESNAVAFQVVDPGVGDSARGPYGGVLPGVLRPLLRWTATPRFAVESEPPLRPDSHL